MNEKTTSTIKVLTVLTIIGCVFDFYSSIKEYLSGDKTVEKIKNGLENVDTNSFLSHIYNEKTLAIANITYQNKLPFLLINLIATSLCLFGAIKMRQMKKDGFYLWLLGEILPTIGIFIFTGFLFFQTIYIVGLTIPIIFIGLYLTQFKYFEN